MITTVTKENFDKEITEAKETVLAVSYTHLDVYKRQTYDGLTVFKVFKKFSYPIYSSSKLAISKSAWGNATFSLSRSAHIGVKVPCNLACLFSHVCKYFSLMSTPYTLSLIHI